ncbi:MAG: DUF2062 domain-containing protein [Candidatus Omnitrophica bacterium]|nr:DUF2062 domain-containing protein [Candidatus Omnitrophota bacterium]
MIRKCIDWLYKKLFKFNDTPQKIALGLGIGVFTGTLPGVGPLAALFLSVIFKVNRASALAGSLITNTWLSVVTFIFSIKIGSAILGLDWHKVYDDCSVKIIGSNWSGLLKLSLLKVILPVTLGYIVISLSAGLICYLLVLLILKFKKH